MPRLDLPVDDNESVNSLSLSSNENGSVSNRSIASSISLGSNPHLSPPRQIYSPNLQPICQEPTLDAVLRKVCDATTDLEKLTHIQMRVSSNVFGLHQMHIFLPNLMALNLDGSSLESLRDLGCDLNVKYLNVSRCGLKSFDGVSGFETVEQLVADGNDIASTMQLGGLQELRTLSLRSNKIKQVNVIVSLSMCPKLNNLDLTKNAIAEISDYRGNVKTAIPSLLILDGYGFDEIGSNMTECSSSLTSDISKDSGSSVSDRILETNINSRTLIGTNQFTNAVVIEAARRPSTTEDSNSSICSTGEPIVGNIATIRRKRRNNVNKSVLSSSSTSLSSLIESTSQNMAKSENFPKILPQSSVKLEMGVIDTEPMSLEPNEINPEHNVQQLIEMCRKWRELSRKSREKLNAKSNIFEDSKG